MIALLRMAVPFSLLLAGGCATLRPPVGMEPAAPRVETPAAKAPQVVTPAEKAAVAKQETPVAPPPAAPTPAAPVARAEATVSVPAKPAAAAEPVNNNSDRKVVAAAPSAKPAPTVAKPALPPAAKSEPAPAPKPTLDLTTLEKRLKETGAIGLMTKLALKNQVDELLDRFRAHYEGRVKTTVAQLRQPYDMLILKVLTLLQDGDPALAKAIADSREAIWAVLTDPGKFKNL